MTIDRFAQTQSGDLALLALTGFGADLRLLAA